LIYHKKSTHSTPRSDPSTALRTSTWGKPFVQSYQRAGYLGLAISEYGKIVVLKDELGPNHPFVLESERAFEELKKTGKGGLNGRGI
jgi:hypothetical protein